MADQPPIIAAALDKAFYKPGDRIIMTVPHSDPDTGNETITITGTDDQGKTSIVTVNLVVSDPTNLTVSDPSGRAWTKVSDNGSVAVFTATA